ncbi:MAG TPA: methyltransferase [Candidatus Binatus sp.]|jgi:protein-S-isoprenylcysteine O-methyltransferase Ste14|nr:methyltransferase [Candidatus Binatus sp.]
MGDALRTFFLGFYLIVIIVTLVRVLPTLGRLGSAERSATGARRYLPALLLPFGFLVPPGVVLLRVGELAASWNPVRLLGLVLGLYAAVILPWAAATLGRFLVPRAVVFPDHTLVVRGPFRLVRHPVYSGDLALWLGATLGTLNVLLLVLWPLYLAGLSAEASAEEELLAAKFGQAYRDYMARVARFVPTLAT